MTVRPHVLRDVHHLEVPGADDLARLHGLGHHQDAVLTAHRVDEGAHAHHRGKDQHQADYQQRGARPPRTRRDTRLSAHGVCR